MSIPHISSIDAFAGIARGFCLWCESSSPGPASPRTAAIWLARLHAAALELPDAGPGNADGLPDLPADAEENARRNLSACNGWYYREFFDPDPRLVEEPVMGDVGDDLLDVDMDVRGGLVRFDDDDIEAALWHWAHLHRLHWGRHAVGALFALHCLHQD